MAEAVPPSNGRHRSGPGGRGERRVAAMRKAGDKSAPAAVAFEPQAQAWARGWRRLSLIAGLLIFPMVAAGGVPQYARGAGAIAGYAIAGAFFAALGVLGVLSTIAQGRLSRRWAGAAVVVMAVLFPAELPFAGPEAFFLGAALSAIAISRLGTRATPIVGAIALAAFVVPWATPWWQSGPGTIEAIDIVITSYVSYVFFRLVLANRALVEARAEIARLASESERTRIARDLHDLLGHSLTAITVKAGLARRVAASDPGRSLREIAEVEDLSRQALTDVRAAVSRYRDVDLAGELARGRELLHASGVTAEIPAGAAAAGITHQALLAWAVREGLTNVVRHANATRCWVRLTATEVEICDDGVGTPAPCGNGLSGLRERVAAAGGTVEAGPQSPRGWRLRVALGSATGAHA